MRLVLENIGSVRNANVEFNGITVIAGENNTGKSTVGKVLFSVFSSFYQIQERIQRERQESILNEVRKFSIIYDKRIDYRALSAQIWESADEFRQNISALEKMLTDCSDANLDLSSLIDKISDILNVSDDKIFQTVLKKIFDAEFNRQINNIHLPNGRGTVELHIKDERVVIAMEDNQISELLGSFNLNTEAVYLDDPFVVDSMPMFFSPTYHLNHKEQLVKKLYLSDREFRVSDAINEIIQNKKLSGIYEKLNAVCGGNLIPSGDRMGYQFKDSGVVLDVRNMSTGLKTFAILKTLLINGQLQENGVVILDEPEIHLHPEWQLVFAELIVLLQKEFGLHILLNTHSPYFLNAIEVYSDKYGIADRCKYYLAYNENQGASLEDVTADTEQIYRQLARPLQKLENERYRDDQA